MSDATGRTPLTEPAAAGPVISLGAEEEEARVADPTAELPSAAETSPTTEESPTVEATPSEPVGAGGEVGEVEMQCPGCGLVVVGEQPRPTAAWFCPRCDYPLFWADRPRDDVGSASRAARRRLPGSGGRQVLGAAPCWHCGEMSEPGDNECRRCAATLPKPLAPKVYVDQPVPVPVPVLVQPTVWPFIAAAGLGGAAIAAAIATWLAGG